MDFGNSNVGEFNPDVEAFKYKFNKCVSITYKKGVLRTAIGASVLVITALAAYVLRTGNFMPSDIFRQHISFSASILVCSACGSIFSILNGLGWFKKSRSIAKTVGSQVEYYNINSSALSKFLGEILKMEFSSSDLKNRVIFTYVEEKNQIQKQKRELTDLSKCWDTTSALLAYDTNMANSEVIQSIKERFNLMKKNIEKLKVLLDHQNDEKKIKKKITDINAYFLTGIQLVQEYIKSFEENVITY